MLPSRTTATPTPTPFRPRQHSSRSARSWLAACCLLWAAGCDDQRPPPHGLGSSAAAGLAGDGGAAGGSQAGGGAAGAPTADGAGSACEGGEIESCRIDLGEHGGVHHCFEGQRLCEDGQWGPCTGADDGSGGQGGS